jgi:hypothetical protein
MLPYFDHFSTYIYIYFCFPWSFALLSGSTQAPDEARENNDLSQ